MMAPDWAALDAAWTSARRAGVLGSATTEEIVAHAAGYLPAACRVQDSFSAIDLGTGAGVPGVVLAALRPNSHWVLLDGNARRCEHAQSAVRSLSLNDRVDVVHARVEEIAHDSMHRGSYDLVVARSFGPPEDLAECALPLLTANGTLAVSVTAETLDRWELAVEVLPELELEVEGTAASEDGRHALIRMGGTCPPAWPRRPATRRRTPLF